MWACSRRVLIERIAVGPLTTGRMRCFSRYLRGFRPGVLASNYVNTSTTIKNHSLWSWGHLFSVLDVRISLTLRSTQHHIAQAIAIVSEPVYHDEEQYTIRKHRKYFPRQHDRWNRRFQELVEYKNKHGHCNVKQHDPSNKQLGTWVKDQRVQYKKGQLSKNRVSLLNSIGFVWDPNATQWDGMYQQLLEYKAEHGHCNVPQVYPANQQLGFWVKWQRQQFVYFQAGENSKDISQERIEKLDSVGFVWNRNDAMWEESFEKLLRYQEAHMDCNDPHLDPHLRYWVKRRRSEYQKFVTSEISSMSEERVERMESIGFDWDYESTTVCDHVPRFGDPITDTRDGRLIRFFFQNLKGISPENNFSQAGIYGKQLKDFKVDVACLCETNTDFSKSSVLENIEEQTRQSLNERVQLQASSSSRTFATVFQPGGTLIVAAGDCTLGSSTYCDKRGLGRWSSMTFGGALTIFNSYRVCCQNERAGEKTAYMQHMYLLRKEGIKEPNPRQAHLDDLAKAIHDCKDKGQEVVLLMDANETLKPRGKFAEFVEELELTEPIKDRFASQTNPVPSTYERGPNQIDFMFTTRGINEYIHRCGYLGFDEVIKSDHRGLFFDLNLEGFLKKDTSSYCTTKEGSSF